MPLLPRESIHSHIPIHIMHGQLPGCKSLTLGQGRSRIRCPLLRWPPSPDHARENRFGIFSKPGSSHVFFLGSMGNLPGLEFSQNLWPLIGACLITPSPANGCSRVGNNSIHQKIETKAGSGVSSSAWQEDLQTHTHTPGAQRLRERLDP